MPPAEPGLTQAGVDVPALQLALTAVMAYAGLNNSQVARRTGLRPGVIGDLFNHDRIGDGPAMKLCGFMHLDPSRVLLPQAPKATAAA